MEKQKKPVYPLNPVGKRIKKLREAKGYTQLQMAAAFGVTQSNYGRLEKDDSRISITKLFLFSEILEAPIAEILADAPNGGFVSHNTPPGVGIIENDSEIIISISKNKYRGN